MTMTNNPILDEVHSVREKLLADAGGTLNDLVDRIQAEEQISNRPRFEPRRPVGCNKAAKVDELAIGNQEPSRE
jgi:hypothetical protein